MPIGKAVQRERQQQPSRQNRRRFIDMPHRSHVDILGGNMTQLTWPIGYRRFNTDDGPTDHTPQSDEDTAVLRILNAANLRLPYDERMAEIERVARIELRNAFNEAFSQIGADIS